MSRPSTAILRIAGAATVVLSIATAVFFTLFAVSTTSLRSDLSAPCIASAILDIPTSVLTLLFTVSPRLAKSSLLLSGVVPTVLAGIMSATTLGWINIRYDSLPTHMCGKSTDSMVVGAFAVFVVTIVFQTAFWTLLVLASPSQHRRQQDDISEPITPTLARDSMAELAFPSPVYTHCTSMTPSRDSKRSSFVTQILHPVSSRTKLRNASSIYVNEIPMPTSVAYLQKKEPEVDHFDLWDTSNVGAPERAACTLAAAEFEEDYVMTLGVCAGGVDVKVPLEAEDELRAIGKSINDDRDAHVHPDIHERRNSPPIPDCEIVSRRSSSLHTGRIRSPLVSPRAMTFGQKNSFSISSRSSRQGHGLELAEVFGSKGDTDSGKWTVKPQATMVA